MTDWVYRFVRWSLIRSYAAQHQMSLTEVVLLGLNKVLSDPE